MLVEEIKSSLDVPGPEAQLGGCPRLIRWGLTKTIRFSEARCSMCLARWLVLFGCVASDRVARVQWELVGGCFRLRNQEDFNASILHQTFGVSGLVVL